MPPFWVVPDKIVAGSSGRLEISAFDNSGIVSTPAAGIVKGREVFHEQLSLVDP